MIVLDANILIRAVLGRRVRQLVETYAPQGMRFVAPDVCFDDAEKYLPDLLKKRGRAHADVPAALEYLRNVISPSSGFFSMVLATWASTFARKHCGSVHYVESGQIASLSCWLFVDARPACPPFQSQSQLIAP